MGWKLIELTDPDQRATWLASRVHCPVCDQPHEPDLVDEDETGFGLCSNCGHEWEL